MGDSKPTIPEMETEEELIAAAKQIMKALETIKNLTDDSKKILGNLCSQLCDITRENEQKYEGVEENGGPNEIEQQLDLIQDNVLNWERDQSTIRDCGSEEAYEYLKAVDEARKLTESLERLSLNNGGEDTILLRRAHDVLQMAMARLEEEFKHLLVQNRQPFEVERMSFRSSEDDIMEAGSVISLGGYSLEDVVQRDSMSREYIIELVHPDVILDLKSIANLMFDSNYGRECSQAFISVQKDSLDDCIYILEVEKPSIEDVLRMEWNTLNSKIRRWIRAMKIFVRVCLASEKLLSDKIFGDLESISSVCFVESSKTAILQLLNLGEVIAIGPHQPEKILQLLSFGEVIAIDPHQPEKLIRILDTYVLLADLIPDIDTLYSDDSGSCVRIEWQDILRRLGDCAKATFLEFENAVATNVSTNPFPGGGVHPLPKYVMNYMESLADYRVRETLDVILKDHEREDPFKFSPDMSPVSEEENIDRSSSVSPMARHFQSLIEILECNLNRTSKLYKDDSLQQLFLMNNIHYMAEKVKRSKLRTVLGNGWIRKHNWKFQQHAMNYERASWSSISSLLRDEGIQNPGSNSISRTILKERLQSFYLAFDEVYKNQTGWSIPNSQLREELRISISLKVIQAYRTFVGRHINNISISLKVIQAFRTFVGRHINNISEKHIKYTADDLEDLLLYLFEGSQKSLHDGHKN